MTDEIFIKDPDATLDYEWDWEPWLDGDTIASVTVSVPTGLTSSGHTNTTKVVKIWLSGGTVGERYQVSCKITTALGRTDERTFLINCADK